MYLRAEYYVGPNLRFLSNLDMNRMMERSLRRAGIPYALSQGFNPHIKLSMGTVLPVGLWGEKEYFDLEISEALSEDDFTRRMNQVLPEGVSINNCLVMEEKPLAIMRVINAASYAFLFNKGFDLHSVRDNLLSSDSLIVKSRGKKKDIDKDLKLGLYNIEVKTGEDFDIMEMWAASGQPINIRYDELRDLLNMRGLGTGIVDVYRKGNFIRDEVGFHSLLEKVK